VLEHQDFDADLPLEKARTLPSTWYRSSEIQSLECRHIFGNTWQALARTEQLEKPGSFVTADLAGEPIVIVRDGEGTLRAFSNVCRHRAARVVCEDEGIATRLRCRYHGWTYDLSGNLRGVPDFDGVEDFRREGNGLPQLEVAEWGPFVWVHAGTNPPALIDYLAPLPERSVELHLQDLKFVARREYRLQCNWKVYVDNYLDGGYHVQTVHPGLAGALDGARYKTEVFERTSLQSSPLRSASGQNSSVRRVRSGAAAFYWWVFPNLMINVCGPVMDTNLVLPIDAASCRVIFGFHFANCSAEAEGFRQESMAVAHQIQLEDIGICEDVQRGLASCTFVAGRFSVRRESAGYRFHRLIAGYLRQGPVHFA
jgi:choline monooxygenase